MKKHHSRRVLLGGVIVLAAASLVYRLLVFGQLEQTAALFVGLPAFLAIALILAPSGSSPMAVAMRTTTLGLLLSGILLGEGFVCILMSAPLFYLIVALLVKFSGWIRGREPRNHVASCFAVLPLIAMSVEGTTPELSFARDDMVSVEKHFAASAEAIESALSQPPRFEATLPFFLQLGFPRPVSASGSGLRVGDRRSVHFAGGEGQPGNLVVVVAGRRDGFVRFEMVEDHSHIAHWLQWRSTDVRWIENADGTVRVRWNVTYQRRLDPAWYFGPWERYAVRLAVEHLASALAPAGAVEIARDG